MERSSGEALYRQQLDPTLLVPLLEATQDGLIVVDPKQATVFYANQAACAILDCSPEHLIGHTWEIPLSTSPDQGSLDLLPQPNIFTLRRSNGEEREIEFTQHSLPANEQLLVATSLRDVTELRQLTRRTNALTQDCGERDLCRFA